MFWGSFRAAGGGITWQAALWGSLGQPRPFLTIQRYTCIAQFVLDSQTRANLAR